MLKNKILILIFDYLLPFSLLVFQCPLYTPCVLGYAPLFLLDVYFSEFFFTYQKINKISSILVLFQ